MKDRKDNVGYEINEGVKKYQDIYDEIWRYCWKHMIDHKYGAWFRIRYTMLIF